MNQITKQSLMAILESNNIAKLQQVTMATPGYPEIGKLRDLAKAFPEQFSEVNLILDNNPTSRLFLQAVEARWQRLYEENKGDIVQAAKVLDQGKRTPASIISKIPSSLTAMIASFLGDNQLPKYVKAKHEKKPPSVLAYENLKEYKPVDSPGDYGPGFFKSSAAVKNQDNSNGNKPKK